MAGRSLEEQLAEAVATIEALRAENEALRDQVAALKSLLGADSSTSSKPPSSDPVAVRKKRAERRADARAAKRAQGKQPGARASRWSGAALTGVSSTNHRACSCCGADQKMTVAAMRDPASISTNDDHYHGPQEPATGGHELLICRPLW